MRPCLHETNKQKKKEKENINIKLGRKQSNDKQNLGYHFSGGEIIKENENNV